MESVTHKVSAVVVLVLALAGCSGGGEGSDARSAPAAVQQGRFEGVPLPPLAEAAGERSEEDGVVTQSFFVRNRTPESVLEFYAEYFRAQDVPTIAAPALVSGVTWRGWWLLDGQELLVSALPAPASGGGEPGQAEAVTQMSLELWPPGGAEEHAPEVTSRSG